MVVTTNSSERISARNLNTHLPKVGKIGHLGQIMFQKFKFWKCQIAYYMHMPWNKNRMLIYRSYDVIIEVLW